MSRDEQQFLSIGYQDRKSVVQGKSVDLGGRRIIKKKKEKKEKKERKEKKKKKQTYAEVESL